MTHFRGVIIVVLLLFWGVDYPMSLVLAFAEQVKSSSINVNV